MHLPRINKIIYGKNAFKYYAGHIWDSLPESIKPCTYLYRCFNLLLKTWECPKCQCKIYTFMLNL